MDELKRRFANKIFGTKPTALGNIIRGNPVKLNVAGKGGLTSPLPNDTKFGFMPAQVSKKSTPKLIAEQLKLPRELKLPKFQAPKIQKPKIATKITSPLPRTQIKAQPKPATPTPTPNPKESWKNMADMIIREGNKRGYHGETLARQKALESGRGTSKFAQERNNYGGMGAYDRDPNNAFEYATPEEYLMGKSTKGAPGYFNLIEKDPRYKEAYKHRGNPRRYVRELKKAGYASDPDYEEKILNTKIY